MRARLGRRAGNAVRWVSRRFGPRREAALLAVVADTRAFVAGRQPPGPPQPERRTDRELRDAYAGVDHAVEVGDLGNALERVRLLSEQHPDNKRVLRLRRLVEERCGDVSGQVRTLHRLHLLDDDGGIRRTEREVLGRIIETNPGWLPRIAGPPRPVAPRATVVLHLLKESTPYVTNAYTARSIANLSASRATGMTPEVVTSLGFPRLTGIEEVATTELVEGVPHHRLDLGPRYSLARPADELLTQQAWLTARIARQVRPEVIHASSGQRGYETALVGAALRDHVRRPLVYEVRSFLEEAWSSDRHWSGLGEQYERRRATDSEQMRGADHVVAVSEAMRDEIVARGVDRERITVVPDGVDPQALAPRPPSQAVRTRFDLVGRFVVGTVETSATGGGDEALLIEAVAILVRRRRRVACLFFGDGSRKSDLEAVARRLGVTANVAFADGPDHDVGEYYSVLDAFVAARRKDRPDDVAPPHGPLEAMAMMRPLVVADVPALTEIAGNDRGLTYAAGDAAALAAELERLIEDASLGTRLGTAGREWVVRDRTWQANGERLREVYERVLADWDGGRSH